MTFYMGPWKKIIALILFIHLAQQLKLGRPLVIPEIWIPRWTAVRGKGTMSPELCGFFGVIEKEPLWIRKTEYIYLCIYIYMCVYIYIYILYKYVYLSFRYAKESQSIGLAYSWLNAKALVLVSICIGAQLAAITSKPEASIDSRGTSGGMGSNQLKLTSFSRWKYILSIHESSHPYMDNLPAPTLCCCKHRYFMVNVPVFILVWDIGHRVRHPGMCFILPNIYTIISWPFLRLKIRGTNIGIIFPNPVVPHHFLHPHPAYSSVLHHIAAHSHTIDLLRDLCRRFLWDASLGEKLTTELKKSIWDGGYSSAMFDHQMVKQQRNGIFKKQKMCVVFASWKQQKIELAQQRGGSLLATKTGLKPTGMHCMRRSNVTN